MKTKIKRHSHAVLSVVLAVCMLLSCMTVGLIATDAAKVTDQGAVGASTDTQPATDEGAALDNDETADLSESGEGALGANLDEDSPLGAADVYAVSGSWNSWNFSYFNASTKKVTANLTAGQTYEFKIVSTYDPDNHRWYGASKNYTGTDSEYYFNHSNDNNATIKASVTGTYTFELKREEQNDGAVAIAVTYPSAATNYTITKAATTNGSFTVSKTTATAGTSINVTATPNRGYKLSTVSVTGASVTGSGNTRTFTMPSQNVTVTVTFTAATSRTITAKVNSGSGTVTLSLSATAGGASVAAVTTSGTTQSSITAYDGEILTITATPASGYQLNTLTRGGASVASGSTWTVSGATAVLATFTVKSTQDNEYNATAGTSITGNSDLYSKIKATFFDYYTDNEVNGNWYSSIDATKDAWVGKDSTMSNIDRNPYETLNNALSKYASDNSVARPMYFGSFYWDNAYHDPGYTKSAQTTYNGHKINDSNQLTGGNTAVLPGLAGKTISDGSIYYYGTGTNENGAENPLFNKEWLASRGSSGDSNKLKLVYSSSINWSDASANVYVIFRNSWPNEYVVKMTNDSTNKCFTATIPSGWENSQVCFVRMASGTTLTTGSINNATTAQANWDKINGSNCWNKTDTNMTRSGNVFTLTSWTGGTWSTDYNGPLASIVNSPFPVRKTTKDGIAYYEFDSTGATDNVYFDNLTGGSPVIQYGSGTTYGQKNGYNEGYGFFPFDKYTDQKISGQNWTKSFGKDLGFGMKLEIKFTVGAGGKINNVAQKFDFSGDDDLWVYIDDKLVLDMGGDHAKATGSIDFSTRNVSVTKTDTTLSSTRNTSFSSWFDNNDTSKVHTMTLYYMERGMHESNLKFGFSFNPQDDAYDVQKAVDVDTNKLNAGLKSQFSDTFTFKNTAGDNKGSNASYTLYNSATNTSVGTGTTNPSREFTMAGGRYAQFKNTFTINQTLQTQETTSGLYQYDTSYSVIDIQNNNSVIKAGTGRDTGAFNFFTNLENADPDLNITHLRTIFTNTLKTESFMITKDIQGFDDSSTAFPFYVTIKMTPGGGASDVVFNTEGLVYKSSLDNYTATHTLGEGGLGTFHEGEFILFEGIPMGAKVTVYEPVFGTLYTPNTTGDANCYKNVTINNTNSANQPQYTMRGTNHADVTIQLDGFDTITIVNEPKNYRMDYQLPTRLYGNKIYKLTGNITPAMVAQGYVDIDNTQHTAFLTRKFVSDHIPYETIFMKNVIWNSANTDFERSMTGIDDYVYLAASSTDQKLTVKVDRDGNGSYETTVNNLDCGSSILLGGDYITGTAGTPSYWDIYSTDTNAFVTRCYSRDLMYVAYDNYSIKAVYGQGTNSDLYDNYTSATVNNLGITRSHWNDTTSGSDDPSTYTDPYSEKTENYKYYKADTEYDRLYIDIELAYEAEGKMIKTFGTDVVSVGYQVVVLNDNGTVNRVSRTVDLANTDLNNKNRVHVYYGFINTEANRGLKLGIRAFINYNGTTYSEVMPFELNTEGSKGLSSSYDTNPPA